MSTPPASQTCPQRICLQLLPKTSQQAQFTLQAQPSPSRMLMTHSRPSASTTMMYSLSRRLVRTSISRDWRTGLPGAVHNPAIRGAFHCHEFFMWRLCQFRTQIWWSVASSDVINVKLQDTSSAFNCNINTIKRDFGSHGSTGFMNM